METFASRHNLQHLPFGMQATAFISNISNIKNSTRLTYARALKGLATKIELQAPLLSLYTNALTAVGSGTLTELHQAQPATKAQAETLINWLLGSLNSPRTATAVYLMWKTASRWDDLRFITKESLIHHERQQLVIEWRRTKTNRAGVPQVSGWTVVEENQRPNMINIVVDTFSKLRPNEFLCPLETREFVRLIQRQPTCRTLTAHSFKRGAAMELWHHAAAQRIDPRLIPILMKHKDRLHDYPVSTIRYAPNKVDLARAFQSQQLTRWL